jgi:hypothetical protein
LLDVGDRRRIVLASALTLVALPFLYTAKRDSRETAPAVAALAPGAGDASAALSSAGSSTTVAAAADAPPSVAASSGPANIAAVQPVTIGVAAPPGPQTSDGLASYKRWGATAGGQGACATRLAPIGTRVVVTNTDNGHRVACRVASNDAPDGVSVVIDTELFLDLADLVAAPIPVSLSW